MTETDPIEISRASGTTKIWYDHEGSTPGTMKGGDVKVLNADAGAHMILITGKNGIEKGFAETDGAGDRNKVSEVLNSWPINCGTPQETAASPAPWKSQRA